MFIPAQGNWLCFARQPACSDAVRRFFGIPHVTQPARTPPDALTGTLQARQVRLALFCRSGRLPVTLITLFLQRVSHESPPAQIGFVLHSFSPRPPLASPESQLPTARTSLRGAPRRSNLNADDGTCLAQQPVRGRTPFPASRRPLRTPARLSMTNPPNSRSATCYSIMLAAQSCMVILPGPKLAVKQNHARWLKRSHHEYNMYLISLHRRAIWPGMAYEKA